MRCSRDHHQRLGGAHIHHDAEVAGSRTLFNAQANRRSLNSPPRRQHPLSGVGLKGASKEDDVGQTLRVTALMLLLGGAVAAAQNVPDRSDARLAEAQEALKEGTEFAKAGQYAEAISRKKHALDLLEAALGKDHPAVNTVLNNLANLYQRQGLYDQAEPLYSRTLASREAALGENHPLVANSLNNLAALYREQGLFDQAEPLYERALAIFEATLGPNHHDVAAPLNNLGNLFLAQGRYDRAEPLYARALAILEATLGPNHPDVATSLNNLAVLYDKRGSYQRSESLYARALAIREATLDPNHPDVAASLSNLGSLFFEQGLYDRAAPLYARALAIRETTLGPNHPDVAASLNNLGNLFVEQGLYDRAEPLYARALAIRETTLGPDHPDVAHTLDSLGNVYLDRGSYNRAALLYERARTILEETLGSNHPEVATSLVNLANLYQEQGLFDRAEPLYLRALAIDEATSGKEYVGLTTALDNLGRLRLGQGRLAEAVPLLTRALTIAEARVRREALDFSESRLAGFLQFLRQREQRLHYSLARAQPNDAAVRRLALTSALLLKGRSAEQTAGVSRAILGSLGPRDRDAFERLRALRAQFAQLSLSRPGNLSSAEYQRRLERLTDDGDALEADLAKRSAPLRALTGLPSPADILQRVAAALPRDGVLVELVDYADSFLAPKPGAASLKLPPQPRYLALVLFPDGRTAAVDLGPADAIDTATSRLRDSLASRDAGFQSTARELYRLAFKPLLPVLGATRRVFLAPDGQLCLAPFAALHDGRRFLADAYDFTYLTSGRDLLPRPSGAPASAPDVVLADPDFGPSPAAPDGEAAPALPDRSDSLERFLSEDGASLSERRWVSLPGTRLEARAIQHLLPRAQIFLGVEASKERLLHLETPRILHVATHGFFMEDVAALPGTRGLGIAGPTGGAVIPRAPDPLLRSGLVLSGAGSRANLGGSLVTALELAGLNLWGTELVVLSACDTGRGDVALGQGVYGLRRALVIAGAEALVVSLWKVDDETTSALMERYYRNLLAGRGRAEALRLAMRAFRAEHPHPHDWAPFIAIGRDTPLSGFGASAKRR